MPFVVVVEDDEDAREALCHLFEDGGYGCHFVPGVDEALRLLEGLKCDLVVTDFDMPVKDGGDLVRELRTFPRHRTTPIIVLSGRERYDWSDPNVTFVPKPPDADELLVLARKLIASTAAV